MFAVFSIIFDGFHYRVYKPVELSKNDRYIESTRRNFQPETEYECIDRTKSLPNLTLPYRTNI